MVLCLAFISAASASENKTSGWLGTFSNTKLSEKYSYWIETQMRYNFDTGGTNQILYRTGLLQSIGKGQGLGYLYGYIQSASLKEHRFTLQHTMKYSSSFSHRARLELRLMEDDRDTASRFRYLGRYQRGISKNYKLALWNEFFLNTNQTSWNGDRFFERNRLFLGVRRNFEKFSVEAGYLNQFVPRENRDTYEHIAVIYLFL